MAPQLLTVVSCIISSPSPLPGIMPAPVFSLFFSLPSHPTQNFKTCFCYFSKHSVHLIYSSSTILYHTLMLPFVCLILLLGCGCPKGQCFSLTGCSNIIKWRNIDSEVYNYMLNAFIAVVSHSLVSSLGSCDDLCLWITCMMVKNEEVNLSAEKHTGYFHVTF